MPSAKLTFKMLPAAFRKKMYDSIDLLQQDLDIWMDHYNNERPHSGRYCYGKTPMETFIDSVPLAKDKMITEHFQPINPGT